MEIRWVLDRDDVQRIQAFVEAQSRDNAFVRNRIETNINNRPSSVSLDNFWQVLVGCLLSSQQRSGPGSPISQLLGTRPFPLSIAFFQQTADPTTAATQVLKDFGGIRFVNRIPDQLARNFTSLEDGLWSTTEGLITQLIQNHSAAFERETAEFIHRHYAGFGPKQSRNLLQGLGLTQYEIPIDSRIIKWLNAFGFPVHLTGSSLGDAHYYNFISDGIQAMCQHSGILPCVFDAAIFSSYDGDSWNEANIVW